MTRCGFGYPISPGSRHVFFCDDEAVDSFTQPLPGSSNCSVQVRVCDAHAEWLRFEYLLRHAVSRSDLPLTCVCGDSTAPGVHHRLSGPCHVDLGVETHEITTREDGSADLVRKFHEAFDLPINDTTRTLNKLRADLIREEANEAADALENEGPNQWAKELADLVIVAHGAALTFGIDLDEAVRLVHASNMSKLGPDGRPVKRADGKVLKGPHYCPPDMTSALPAAAQVPPAQPDATRHEHTDALCGHDLTAYDPEDGSHVCLACDEIDPRTSWRGEKCVVFRAEMIESVKLAERNGDIPVFADETMIDREDQSQ